MGDLSTAINRNDIDKVKELLKDPNLDLSEDQDAILLATDKARYDIFKLLLKDKRIDLAANYERCILRASREGQYKILKLLLKDQRVNPVPINDQLFQRAGDSKNAPNIYKLLLNDSRLTPRRNELQRVIDYHPNPKVIKLLLSDRRINPAEGNNEPIREAIKNALKHHEGTKYIDIVKLLLADNRVDPFDQTDIMQSDIVIDRLLKRGSEEFILLFLPHLKYAGISCMQYFDPKSRTLKYDIKDFLRDPYLFLQKVMSPSQKSAFKIITIKDLLKKMENEEQDRVVNNPESAMSMVSKANQLFEEKVKPFFNQRFLEFGKGGSNDNEIKQQAIIAIEKQIRGMLLDEILEGEKDLTIINFINKHKDELMEGKNKALMREAREKYFISKTDDSQVAWRGYDPDAPRLGGYPNLLTEQPANRLEDKAQSNEVRERVAYYYLLITDTNDGLGGSEKEINERIKDRKVNFISTLSEMRHAHFREGQSAVSCYPGYIGRTASLGYDHPLVAQNMTAKELVPDIMRPIILEAFKKALKELPSEEACEKLLLSLSNLTDEQGLAKAIFLKQVDFPNELLEIRGKFIESFNKDALFELVDKELQARGHDNLRDKQKLYVQQCLEDPARGTMMGLLGGAYSEHVQKVYPKEAPEKIYTKLENPFKSQYEVLNKTPQAQKNPAMFTNRLKKIKEQEEIFDKLSKVIQEKFLPKADVAGLAILIETITQVIYESDSLKLENNNIEPTIKSILEETNIRKDLDSKLEEKSDRPGYSHAFSLLQDLSSSKVSQGLRPK